MSRIITTLATLLVVGLTTALAVTGLSPGSTAQAAVPNYTFLGCRYAGANPVIWVRSSQLGDYEADLDAAVERWNRRRKVPGSFIRTPPPRGLEPSRRTARRSGELRVGTVTSVLDAWAWIGRPSSLPPRCLGGSPRTYGGNSTAIYLNDALVADLPAAQRRLILQHELGHALGLGHVPPKCRRAPAVMVQGTAKWACGWPGTSPWRDDRRGVRALYRGERRG